MKFSDANRRSRYCLDVPCATALADLLNFALGDELPWRTALVLSLALVGLFFFVTRQGEKAHASRSAAKRAFLGSRSYRLRRLYLLPPLVLAALASVRMAHRGMLQSGAAEARNKLAPVFMVVDDLAGTDPADQPGTWHSADGQDHSVSWLTNDARERFFVDLAANKPIRGSNTRALERDLGWKGVCIEANRDLWQALLTHRSCTLVGATIADQSRQVRFQMNGETGGIVSNETDSQGLYDTHGRLATLVQTVSFGAVLAQTKSPATIDYLSLDVEGAEHIVMQSFPFARYNISILTVERPKPVLVELLSKHGYCYLCDHGSYEDQMWLHKSFRRTRAGLPPKCIAKTRAHQCAYGSK